MNKTAFETYCANCDMEVAAIASHIEDELDVRGDRIRYEAVALHCPECGRQISDSRIENENLQNAYAVYGANHQIPLPEEITALRNKYGLSLREFSKFLGFGEQTVARYEKGSLPDEAHAFALRQAQNPEGASALLEANQQKLLNSSIQKVQRFIEAEQNDRTVYALMHLPISLLEDRLPKDPCRANGYRVFEFQRAAALAQMLADKCRNLYKTKFQKAMFYADMLACEKLGRSLTGLQYAHGTYGPVIDGKDELTWRLTSSDVLMTTEDEWGEILSPGERKLQGCFDEDESAIIEQVAVFVNSFPRAKDLVDYSHNLNAWGNTENGKIIEYNANHGEIEASVLAR